MTLSKTLEQTAEITGLRDPMLPEPFVVRKVTRETRDTFTLEIEPAGGPGSRVFEGAAGNGPQGGPAEGRPGGGAGAPAGGGAAAARLGRVLPAAAAEASSFAPGQFNMLYVYGVGEVPISISGDPARTNTLLHTVRAVGTVTNTITRLKKGQVIGVRGPYGTPWPVEGAKGSDVVIVAGGIGLAPLRPAIYHLLHNRRDFGHVVLLYGTRSPEDFLYRKEVERWRGRFDLQVEATVDAASNGWGGNVGVVTTLIPRAHFDADSTVAMVCGPEIMMRFAVLELMKVGVSADRIYLSMERNMKCGIGFCGHCQCGPKFICKDGPVFRYDVIKPWFEKREI